MDEQFGVITIKENGVTTVIFDGTDKQLFSILDIVKEIISDSAEVRLLDKTEYATCKDNIIELNKLLA